MYADTTGPRGDIHPKGSWVAHTLRQLIGDEAFFTSLRILVYGRPDPRPGNFVPQFGTTLGFLAIVNRVTGADFTWFFNVYLYRAALTIDPSSKILRQLDALDRFEEWQARRRRR